MKSRLFGSSYKILEWEVPSCALVWMNWSVHFSLVSFSLFFLVWGEAPPSLVEAWDLCFHFPNLIFLWTLQNSVNLAVLCSLSIFYDVGPSFTSHSRRLSPKKCNAILMLVISCHILLSWHFPVFLIPSRHHLVIITSSLLCRTARLATNCSLRHRKIPRDPAVPRVQNSCPICPICPFHSFHVRPLRMSWMSWMSWIYTRFNASHLPDMKSNPWTSERFHPSFLELQLRPRRLHRHVMCDLVWSCVTSGQKWT